MIINNNRSPISNCKTYANVPPAIRLAPPQLQPQKQKASSRANNQKTEPHLHVGQIKSTKTKP